MSLQEQARVLGLQYHQLQREYAAAQAALQRAHSDDDPSKLAEHRARAHLDRVKRARGDLNRSITELHDEWERLGRDTARAIDEARDELDDRRNRWGIAGALVQGLARVPADGLLGALSEIFGSEDGDALDAAENFMTPAGVRALLAKFSRAELEAFARAEPEFVSTLDGAPAWMRDIANRRKIQAEIERLEPYGELTASTGARLRKLLAVKGALILLFDSHGDGKVAVAFGAPDGADNIAVMIPGMSTTLGNFDGMMGDAGRLLGRMKHYGRGAQNAVVAWLGYDPPDVLAGVDPLRAVSQDRARDGAASLRPFVDGLNANAPDSNMTVIGHSYGSLTTGIAARDGHLAADDVVFIGSPGTGVNNVSSLHLDPGAQVFAAARHRAHKF